MLGAAFLLMLPMLVNSKSILSRLEIDEQTSNQASRYIYYQLPALVVFGLLEVDRNFLTSFGRADISM